MTRILAVIHHLDDRTSAANAEMAADAGCDGVVLIEMRGRDHLIDGPSADAKRRHPNLIVVANRLSSSPVDAIARDMDLGLDGSWSDDRVATSSGALPVATEVALKLEEARRTNPAYLFFASVAFKTHDHEPAPEIAAREAAAFPWIVTTSGPATGSPPTPGKLAAMADEIGKGRLAVASGIDPENAPALLPHVGWALVATGISRDFFNLDATMMARLVEIARAA